MDLKKLIEKMTKDGKNKYLFNLMIIALVGILILIAASMFKDNNASVKTSAKINDSQTESQDTKNYELQLENKLKDILQRTDGIGNVSVMIYFEGGDEQIPAVNVTDSTSTTEEKDASGGVRSTTQKNTGSTVVTTNDGTKNEPLILKQNKPKVTGVYVVAEGAEDEIMQLKINKAVTDLFNISPDKVAVFPMKK
ncbi:MAG: stage III sporulation protein AG [Bacillota bacterium]|nr:stage III sporulation protein AG [Bacillota bacterium]